MDNITADQSAKLKDAGDKLVEVSKEIDQLKSAIVEEESQFIDISFASDEAKQPLRALQEKLYRAQTEYNRLKAVYDSLVTQFKYGR